MDPYKQILLYKYIGQTHNMHVKHNFELFQRLCNLFKVSYIDYTFNDESIIE